MTRNFESRPIPEFVLAKIVSNAQRAPSAGHSQGTSLIILASPQETEEYWKATTTSDWRENSRRSTLMDAPVVILVCCDPTAYTARYSLDDKIDSDLSRIESWPVPYWTVDASMCAMTILLTCTNEGLGACFLGMFRGEGELRQALSISDHLQLIGAICAGYPKLPDPPSRSALIPKVPIENFVRWRRGG